jgi:hypothetical protein
MFGRHFSDCFNIEDKMSLFNQPTNISKIHNVSLNYLKVAMESNGT